MKQDFKIQEGWMSFVIMTLSELYGREIAIEKETNLLCFIEIIEDEVTYTPINIDTRETSFGLNADFFFPNNQHFEPSKHRPNTVHEPSKYHVSTVHEPSNGEVYTVQKLTDADFVEEGADGMRIVFNSQRKVNLIACTISDKDLKAEAEDFERLILDKLIQGISDKAKRNTHDLFKKYEKLIKGKDSNKLLVLSEMADKLSDSIIKSRQEKNRTNSRLNEEDKRVIKATAQADVWRKFKIRAATAFFILAISGGIYAYHYVDFSKIESYIPTLFINSQARETNLTYTNSENTEIRKAQKTWSNSEIENFINIYAKKRNLKVWEYRRGKIKEALSAKQFTPWEATKIINNQLDQIK